MTTTSIAPAEHTIQGVLNALRTFLVTQELDETKINVHVGPRHLRITTDTAILLAESELQALANSIQE